MTQKDVIPDSYHQSQQYLLGILNSARVARALEVVVTLGIADLLQEGAKSVAELAKQTSSNEDALYRLLRALVSVDIFTEDAPKCFSLTVRSSALPSNKPGSVAGMAIMMGDEWFLRSFEKLEQCILTGNPVIADIYGTDLWTYFTSQSPEAGRHFDTALTNAYELTNMLIAQAYNFSNATTLVDVGGGQGRLLAAILRQHKQLRGILFDRPDVVEKAIVEPEIASRFEARGGNFFETVPAGADIYLMRQVLHDHGDELCVHILNQCRKSLPSDGRLLIVERVIGPGSSPADYFLDVQLMLHMPGARERTKEEFVVLLERSGLTLNTIFPTRSPFCLLEARQA
jgi:O-methyltransferase domain